VTPEQLARLPTVLFEIGKVIGSEQEPALTLARISELLCELLDAEACSVMLLDPERQRLQAKASHGLRAERIRRVTFAVGEGVAGWVIAHGEPALIDDVALDPRFVVLDEPDVPGAPAATAEAAAATPIVALACVPLEARGERIGVLTATSGRRGAFAAHHVELMRFVARTLALDVQNLRLARVAVTDVLTGAYNREFLGQQLPQELARAVAGDQPLSVAMIDVDHFKQVNDRHGHDVGDEVLVEFTARLRGAIRGDDLLVRYGGEEFLAVLPRADAGRAWEVAERMRARVSARPFVVGELALSIAASLGIAQLRTRPSAETAAELIRRADAALYAAKANGRDRVEVAP
jgi:diguanylate cyclase (GGDEF)-like protein